MPVVPFVVNLNYLYIFCFRIERLNLKYKFGTLKQKQNFPLEEETFCFKKILTFEVTELQE